MRAPLILATILFARAARAAPPGTSEAQAANLNVCGTPLSDTLNGSAGSATTCMPRADATRPSTVQKANAF